MRWLMERFPSFEEMHVVDLGGDTRFWLASDVRPAHVTIVDLYPGPLKDPEPWMSVIQGDACRAETIRGSFDLAFSNSLIEHVGGPRYRQDMADVVRSVAPRYWVQTPYRYFPLEPHFLMPGFQHLPLTARAWLFEHWPLTEKARRDIPAERHLEFVNSHDLLSITEMRALFPDGELIRERVGPLIKSLVAVK